MKSKTPSWKQKNDPVLIEFLKAFIELIEGLLEPDKKSNQDYIERIKNSSIKSFKTFYSEREQVKQLNDLLKLLPIQNLSGISDDISDQAFSISEFENKITPEMHIYINFQFLNFMSIFIEKKSLVAFYKEAKEGNEKSLFKLIRYDKSLFDHEWVRELILEKMLIGNYVFFERLGDAIKSELPIGRHKQGKIKLVLTLFWNVFGKLTYKQQMQLLEDIGLDVPFSYDSYKKLIKREIKPLFKSNQ